MQAKVAGRKLIMVFLDSAGKLSRIGDAERVRRWVETQPAARCPAVTVRQVAAVVRQVTREVIPAQDPKR
jgi:D-alanyl-D-alanine endopeptidase (penicillin-binding protein 7)